MARFRYLAFFFATSALLAVAAGCGQSSAPAEQSGDASAASLTPREIVEHTIAAYRGALAYSDEGEVRLSFKRDGQAFSDEAPLAVQYALPNRLHVAAYQAEIACDGQQLHAIIRDESTTNMDGQVVVRPAPKKITLDDLYADTVLRDTLQSGLGRHPVQLELLFGDAPLLDLLKPETPIKVLDSGEIEGRRCHRLEAKLADGKYVFWIDREDFLLRRIEYPAEALLPELAQNRDVSDLQITAEFRLAKFEKELPARRFAFVVPPGAKQVHYFVLPPQGLPSQLFGQTPEGYTFSTVDDAKVTPEDLSGKLTVLVWFANDANCAWGLKQLSDAVAASSVKDKVNAYAIATEDSSVSSEQLVQLLSEWKVDLDLLRDPQLAGRDIFGVKTAPTFVVLDAEGKVQIFEEGISQRLTDTLPVVLERLAAGEDLAGELLAGARKAEEQYVKDLAIAAGNEATTTLVELPTATPVAASEPEHFDQTVLWSVDTKQIAEPGNFHVVQEEGRTRLFVVDGWRTVVELSEQGEILAKHKLDLPEETGISYLRSAVDKEGKRWFVGSALLGKQVFIFDQDWKLKTQYPPDDQPHDGLHAVEITDLDADGTPELYVGFWSLVGVHGVSLDGKREWPNRVVPTVLSIVTTPPNEIGWRKILVSGDRGYLYHINQFGHHDPKLEVPQRQVHRLAAATWDPPLATTYCGISYLPEGRLLAIGLDAELREIWNYKLPQGQHNNQIEYVASGRLRSDEQGEWLLAAADGSVHIVSDGGEFSDTFAIGELLTGLATAKLGEDRVVITSTKGGVTAWKLEQR